MTIVALQCDPGTSVQVQSRRKKKRKKGRKEGKERKERKKKKGGRGDGNRQVKQDTVHPHVRTNTQTNMYLAQWSAACCSLRPTKGREEKGTKHRDKKQHRGERRKAKEKTGKRKEKKKRKK